MISCMCDVAQVLSSANAPSTAIINNIMVESWCGTTDSNSLGIKWKFVTLELVYALRFVN